MEEDEVVISSWKRSDFEKELNESTERRANNKKLFEGEKASKENVDLNLWRDSGKTNRNFDDEEVTFDDGTLSRLIEGDLKESEDVWTKSSSKPRPKPRQKGFPNTEKDSPADLFSGKNKTDKLHAQTSPRPVPRPRGKPILKENLSGSLGDSGNSTKLSADKLFDSVGKGNKNVSFQDLSENKDSSPKSKKKFGDVNHNVSGNQEDFWKKQTNEIGGKMPKSPPMKPARTKSRSTDFKKDSDEPDSDLRGNSHKPEPRRPTPRKPKDNVTQHNSPAVVHQMGNESKQYNGISREQHVSERERQSNGFVNGKDYRENHMMGKNTEDFNVSVAENDQRFVERMMGHRDNNVLFESGRGSQRQFLGQGQNIDAECSNKQNFERSEQGRFMNSRHSPRHHEDLDNSQRDFYKRDTTQMFEEHVPITENVLGRDEQKNYTKQRGRIEGKYKPNTPLKAEKRLEEMTKSPELYNNFHYESRDTPQSLEFSSGKIGFSTKRSSSLTNLDDWRNTEFKEDQDVDEPGSWQSRFTSSTSIRQAVYNEWLEKKQKELKEKSKKKVDEKKNEEEKLKEQELERQLIAKKAFEAWSSSKEVYVKDQVKKMKEIKDKEIDKKRENTAKRRDAKKFFESWKSKKDEVLKESYKEKKTNEKDAKQKEYEDKQEKIEIAKKSYDKWKVRKDEHIKEELKSKQRGDLLKTKYEKEAEMEKCRERENTFQEFLKKKGTWKRPPPTPNLTQRPWCPGGLTKGANLIPDNINPVIPTLRLNRSRSFSGASRTLR